MSAPKEYSSLSQISSTLCDRSAATA
jgi:hypothetical protein